MSSCFFSCPWGLRKSLAPILGSEKAGGEGDDALSGLSLRAAEARCGLGQGWRAGMRPQGEGLWPYGKIYNALYRWEGRPRTRKRHQGLRVGEGGERRGSEMKTQFWESEAIGSGEARARVWRPDPLSWVLPRTTSAVWAWWHWSWSPVLGF